MSIQELRQAVEQASGLIQTLASIQDTITPLIEQAQEVIRQSDSVTITEEMVRDMQTLAGKVEDSVDEISSIRDSLPDLSEIEGYAQSIIDAVNYQNDSSGEIDSAEENLGRIHSDMTDFAEQLRAARQAQIEAQPRPEQAAQAAEATGATAAADTPDQTHPGRQH